MALVAVLREWQRRLAFSERSARRSLATQRELASMPEVAMAVRSGVVSLEKASAVVRSAHGDVARPKRSTTFRRNANAAWTKAGIYARWKALYADRLDDPGDRDVGAIADPNPVAGRLSRCLRSRERFVPHVPHGDHYERDTPDGLGNRGFDACISNRRLFEKFGGRGGT